MYSNLVHHFGKGFLFVLMKRIVLLDGGHFEFVFGLGLGGLEGAGEDCDLDVLELLGHLRVGEVLVHHHPLHQLGVLQLAPHFALHFNELEIDVPRLHVSN